MDLGTVTGAGIDRAAGAASIGSTDDPEEDCRGAGIGCGICDDGDASGSNSGHVRWGGRSSSYEEGSLAEALRASARLAAAEAADKASEASQGSSCLPSQNRMQPLQASAKQHSAFEEVMCPEVQTPAQQAQILSHSAQPSAWHSEVPTREVEGLELSLERERRRVGELQRCLKAVHAAGATAKAAAAGAAQQAVEHAGRLTAANEVCHILPFRSFQMVVRSLF